MLFRGSVLVDRPFQNMLKLFPTAQTCLRKVIDAYEKCPEIERITVFGSALRWTFSWTSNINIYIDGAVNRHFRFPDVDAGRELAIVTPDMLTKESNFRLVIASEGVVVFDRKTHFI